MRRVFLTLGLIALASPALAQMVPYGTFSTELTGTIAVTGTYQQVIPFSTNGQRKSCTIQNTATHNMLVFFGPTQPGNSSGKGYVMPASTAIYCGLPGGGVALDTVWIEGTAGDTFEYASQP